MPDEYVTMELHTEFEKRMTEEHNRQNHRITKLEEAVENIGKLTIAVEKLAVNMSRMAEEQEKTSARLSKLEGEPGENWKKAVWIVLTALISAGVGYFLH